MAEIMRLDSRNARTAPEAAFAVPREVATHIGLTRGEKIAALQRWGFLTCQRLNAVNEGMMTGADKGYDADCALLDEINATLDELRRPPSVAAATDTTASDEIWFRASTPTCPVAKVGT